MLESLPALENIDLSDCRLTDTSLVALADKLKMLPNLTYLNLSANDVDDSADCLRAYLGSSSCPLKTFILDAADVDDVECESTFTYSFFLSFLCIYVYMYMCG